MPTTGFPDLGLGIGLAVYLGMVAKLADGIDALSPRLINLGL